MAVAKTPATNGKEVLELSDYKSSFARDFQKQALALDSLRDRIADLRDAVEELDKLYTDCEDLNDLADISKIIPWTLDSWLVDLNTWLNP